MGRFVPPLAGCFCSISSAFSPRRSKTRYDYYPSFVCLRPNHGRQTTLITSFIKMAEEPGYLAMNAHSLESSSCSRRLHRSLIVFDMAHVVSTPHTTNQLT